MMAGLFLLYSLALALIVKNKRIPAMWLIAFNLFLCFLMLWHHATDTLKINW